MKKVKWSISILMVLLFALAPTQTWAKKKVTLRYKPTKGDVYVSVSKIDQNIETQAQGQSFNIHQVMTIEMNTAVESVNDDSFQTSNYIQRFTMVQSLMGQEFKFDSSDSTTYASGRGKAMGESINKTIGKKFMKTIDNKGNEINENSNELKDVNSVLDQNNSGNNFNIIFPEDKISVGDTWEADIKPVKDNGVKVHMKYTLKKVSGKMAEITLEGTLSSDQKGENSGQNVAMKGIQSGTAKVDLNTGWTLSMTMEQELKMNIERAGMKMPMDVNSTITFTSEKK